MSDKIFNPSTDTGKFFDGVAIQYMLKGHIVTKEEFEKEILMETNGFIVKDSGERQSFASGMVRDTQDGKTDFSRILDGPMVERWAIHLTKGAVKYPDVKPGVANWTLANGEEELTRFKKSALRHFIQWYRGDVDEDHAAAVYFNINGKEYVQAKLK